MQYVILIRDLSHKTKPDGTDTHFVQGTFDGREDAQKWIDEQDDKHLFAYTIKVFFGL